MHLGYRAHAADIDLSQLAFETHSYTGAQLASLVNDAAIVAARKHREEICMDDFEEVQFPSSRICEACLQTSKLVHCADLHSPPNSVSFFK